MHIVVHPLPSFQKAESWLQSAGRSISVPSLRFCICNLALQFSLVIFRDLATRLFKPCLWLTHTHGLQESLNTSGWSLKGYLLILSSFKGSRSDYHIMRQDQFCQTIWYSGSLGSHSFSDWERWTWLMVGSQQSAPYCGILWNTIWYCGMLWNTVEYSGSQQSAPSSEDLHPSSKNVPLVTSSTPQTPWRHQEAPVETNNARLPNVW